MYPRVVDRPRWRLASCSRLMLLQVSRTDFGPSLSEEERAYGLCLCGSWGGARSTENPKSGPGNHVPTQREWFSERHLQALVVRPKMSPYIVLVLSCVHRGLSFSLVGNTWIIWEVGRGTARGWTPQVLVSAYICTAQSRLQRSSHFISIIALCGKLDRFRAIIRSNPVILKFVEEEACSRS